MLERSVNGISHKICTGCKMCGDICSRNAISFQMSRGFWFPHVDENSCINCGVCSKKCPVLHDVIPTSGPISCYGAKSKDESIRWNSTSGGFFSELANRIISEKGYCAGAIYSVDNEIIHTVGNHFSIIESLRQSKYAQSNTEGIYRNVKKLLSCGELVLFCGCACQVEALKAFLGKDYDNLITMDFICLGICSPVVYRKYLDYLESKFHSKITKVWFKNKSAGWRSIGVRMDFANGKKYFRTGGRDLFMVAFTGDTIAIRECCESCKFRKIPHNSDLTVADFWGIENVLPVKDDNMGWSAVFANTNKGDEWFRKVSENLDYFETTSEKITSGNFSALVPKKAGANRDAFLDSINYMPFDKAIAKYGRAYSGWNKVRLDLRCYKQVLKKSIIGFWRK